jgi:hypothetical protein
MTLVAAWTRTTRTGRELWVMSDSRLSGGKFWDYGPKIFGIGRSDAVIAFAGDTSWTYPLIAQISSYVESFVNLRDRTIDLAEAYDRILQMLNESLSFISEPAHPSLSVPDCSFIFAGYSVRRKGFFIRRIVFHPIRGRFEGRHARDVGEESIAVIGDKGPVGAIARRLSDHLKDGKRARPTLDMAPAEALFEVISSKRFPEVGGAPQVAKVYQHLSQKHFGVYWPPDLPTDKQHIYLRGRRIGRFDVLDHPWVFDPSAAKLFWHGFSPDERRALGEAESAA